MKMTSLCMLGSLHTCIPKATDHTRSHTHTTHIHTTHIHTHTHSHTHTFTPKPIHVLMQGVDIHCGNWESLTDLEKSIRDYEISLSQGGHINAMVVIYTVCQSCTAIPVYN